MHEAELIAELSQAQGERRAVLTACLGDAEGEHGPRILREIINSVPANDPNLQCTALLALAKRAGEDASEDYLLAARSRGRMVKEYGVLALAAFGDDLAWDEMMARLKKWRSRKQMSDPPAAAILVTYLVRHATSESRLTALVVTLRSVWRRLLPQDREVIMRFWADAAPSGPPVPEVGCPDARGMEKWLRKKPIFGPLL